MQILPRFAEILAFSHAPNFVKKLRTKIPREPRIKTIHDVTLSLYGHKCIRTAYFYSSDMFFALIEDEK
jgi:hypothetical protein